MMLLYVWYLLTIPTDRLVCELWTREISRAAIVQACGVEAEAINGYRLDVYENGLKICETEGIHVLFIGEACRLYKNYDAYRIRIVEPDYQELIGCSVVTPTEDPPPTDEIKRQCGVTDYDLRFAGTRQTSPEPVPCMPPSVTQPASIATSKDLYILAGRLIWHGYARPNCPGGLSGIADIETLSASPCGMDGARSEVIAWQNSLDAAILIAAREWHVPADLLKSLIERETQFWSWSGIHGEQGLVQLTDEGAGNVLHVYQVGYYQMTPSQQAQARAAWLRSLACDYCSPRQAIEKAKQDMSKYAQALAAYYCMYGSWGDALKAWNFKHQEGGT